MRATLSAAVILFVVSTALVPALLPAAAAASEPVDLFLFAGPEGRGVGEDVDVAVQLFVGGVAADADSMLVRLSGSTLTYVDLANGSAGRWNGSFTVDPAFVVQGAVTLTAYATVSGGLYNAYATYKLPSTGQLTGPAVTTRVVSNGGASTGLVPGEEITLESRTYDNGSLADIGTFEFSIATQPAEGELPLAVTATTTKNGTGVYSHTFVVPHIVETTGYLAAAKLTYDTHLYQAYGRMEASPMPVFSYLKDVSWGSADVAVVAGDSSALEGVEVTVDGTYTTFSPAGATPIGPFTGTTNASGQVVVRSTWDATSTGFPTLNISATKDGLTERKTVIALPNPGDAPWQPTPNSPFGCSLRLQVDPASIAPGTDAHLPFQVTDGGSPVAGGELSVFAFSPQALEAAPPVLLPTDADGKMVVAYQVDNAWDNGSDRLAVKVRCPSGESDEQVIAFGKVAPYPADAGLEVKTHDHTDGTATVVARFTDARLQELSHGFAVLVQADDPGAIESVLSGGWAPRVPLRLVNGSHEYQAEMTFPAWANRSQFKLVVFLSNKGQATTLSKEFEAVSVTSIVAPPADFNRPPPQPTPSGESGFLPGPGPVGTLAAMAVVVAGSAVTRRRGGKGTS